MQIAQFEKPDFNLSAICKMKKCLFRSTHWSTVINLCNLWKLHNLQKRCSIWVQYAKRRNPFSDQLVGGSYPYQFYVIRANCTILQKLFSIWVQFAKGRNVFSDLQHWSTVINVCNLCKLHNLQKRFSIWVQFPKWRNVFSDLHIGVPLSIWVICANCTICKSCFQFECSFQNEEMSVQINTMEYRYQFV